MTIAWMLALVLSTNPSHGIVDVDIIEVNHLIIECAGHNEWGRSQITYEPGGVFVNFRDHAVIAGVSRYWVLDWCREDLVTFDTLSGRPIAIVIGRDRRIFIRGRVLVHTYGKDSELEERNAFPDYAQPSIAGMRAPGVSMRNLSR